MQRTGFFSFNPTCSVCPKPINQHPPSPYPLFWENRSYFPATPEIQAAFWRKEASEPMSAPTFQNSF